MKIEIGCGTDKNYRLNPRVRGDDVIYADLEKPASKMSNFIKCDAQLLPFRNSSSTEVYASHLVEHLQNPLKFLLEARRVLVVGGKLWLWTPNFTSPNARNDRSHVKIFNYFSLKAILRQAGFKTTLFLPFVPYKLLKPITLLLANELQACGEKRQDSARSSIA